MRQLAFLDITSLRGTPDWVTEAGKRFSEIGQKTLLVDITAHIDNRMRKKSAQAFNIKRPSSTRPCRGQLPEFPNICYKWHNSESKHCDGLDFTGNCTEQSFLTLLRSMDAKGLKPGSIDLIFFHGE